MVIVSGGTRKLVSWLMLCAFAVCGGGGAAAGDCTSSLRTVLISPSAQNHCQFGGSLATNGNRVLVSESALIQGYFHPAGHVFTRSGDAWTPTPRFAGPGIGLFDWIWGRPIVALWGNTAVRGAPLYDGSAEQSGAVHVFVESGGIWTQTALLSPGSLEYQDFFGNSVSLDGDMLAIGAVYDDWYFDDIDDCQSGAVYVYMRVAGGFWGPVAILTAPDGHCAQFFGWSVSADNHRIAVGAIGAWGPNDAVRGGAVYIFREHYLHGWVLEQRLQPAVTPYAEFGWSLQLHGDRLLVGAHGQTVGGDSGGAAYVYERVAGVWTETAQLVPPHTGVFGIFGDSVALDGDIAVVTAPNEGIGYPPCYHGRVYVFARSAETWTVRDEFRIRETDYPSCVELAASVAINGDFVLAGCPLTDHSDLEDPGAVFVFDLAGRCRGDSNCDGVVNFDDIDYFVTALSGEAAWVALFSGDPRCGFCNNDCNWDTDVNFDDVDSFIDALASGTCIPKP